ncbi:MAG: DUF2007 domain-containing protein [Acidobacteriota bacterium]|jgi:hypothetical protein
MTHRVLCREFNSRGEAEIVRELLFSNGIEAFISSDDCGSVDPALSFARGVQLFVTEEDESLAKRIISEAMTQAPEGEAAADDEL